MTDINDTQFLKDYLKDKLSIHVEAVENAGEGNMNSTLRVYYKNQDNISKSIIVKQSYYYIAQFKSLNAPAERIHIEATFYEYEVKNYLPKLIFFDEKLNIIIMEDLGQAQDLSYLYQDGELTENQISEIADFLVTMHSISKIKPLPNRLMVDFHKDYLFRFPFNHFLDDMIEKENKEMFDATRVILADNSFQQKIRLLEEKYLNDETSLLHGDFHLGSILKLGDSIKVIDAEFAFFGPKEWDLGVLIAHLALTPKANANINQVLKAYQSSLTINEESLAGFTSVEILRRFLGYSKPSTAITNEMKIKLASLAHNMIIKGKLIL